ncbi:SAM-dependent methyltransferase [Streptomyces sp. LP11]|uniref:SAM-dependent methyltransferase n=1 Tax=Streptomyces pyxinicus TaxID=2970331 RepID=A0ABT2AU34_9ACTN|nr:SAM-dependent methyltransferase [Streptomyces sp. LP11]MCS0599751.1 SAM-dependent methyltransferase [Streptomyces sp. LP11]
MRRDDTGGRACTALDVLPPGVVPTAAWHPAPDQREEPTADVSVRGVVVKRG